MLLYSCIGLIEVPKADKRAYVVEAPHGKQRSDPLYWLRDDDRQDPAILDYLKVWALIVLENVVPPASMTKTFMARMVLPNGVTCRQRLHMRKPSWQTQKAYNLPCSRSFVPEFRRATRLCPSGVSKNGSRGKAFEALSSLLVCEFATWLKQHPRACRKGDYFWYKRTEEGQQYSIFCRRACLEPMSGEPCPHRLFLHQRLSQGVSTAGPHARHTRSCRLVWHQWYPHHDESFTARKTRDRHYGHNGPWRDSTRCKWGSKITWVLHAWQLWDLTRLRNGCLWMWRHR